MNRVLEIIKTFDGERNAEQALKVLETLLEETKDLEIELGKEYFVSEWSWNPISDGVFVYNYTIDKRRKFGDATIYRGSTNVREYFIWDLFVDEESCQKMCDFKNSFGYYWEIAVCDFKLNLKIRSL